MTAAGSGAPGILVVATLPAAGSGVWVWPWCLALAHDAKMSYMTWVAPLSHSCLGVRGKPDCLGVAVFSAVDSCVRCWPSRVVLALVSGVGPCVWSMLPTLARLS